MQCLCLHGNASMCAFHVGIRSKFSSGWRILPLSFGVHYSDCCCSFIAHAQNSLNNMVSSLLSLIWLSPAIPTKPPSICALVAISDYVIYRRQLAAFSLLRRVYCSKENHGHLFTNVLCAPSPCERIVIRLSRQKRTQFCAARLQVIAYTFFAAAAPLYC